MTLEAVIMLTEKLAAALVERGLCAEKVGLSAVWAVNRAADPPGADLRATRMSPGLRQSVVCRSDSSGRGMWWWVWPGATRDAEPEYEPLCPATDIDTAADRIAHVLALADG